jgi:beta-N-acetylhexosaminidase
MARACAKGLLDAGCLPVIKHAPGHGRATVDSHKGLPRIEAPLAELQETDFAPFRALADLPMMMTAHIVLPEIDAEVPLTLSGAGVRYLREEIGLKGLLMTDDISMGALQGSVSERGRAALGAGCDLVLHCNGDLAEMEALAEAAGAMAEAAQKRADIALSRRRTPTDIDIPAVEAEFGSLIEGADNA